MRLQKIGAGVCAGAFKDLTDETIQQAIAIREAVTAGA